MYKHFISRRLERQARFRRGRGPPGLFGGSWTAPGQGERGWWVIHGHWEGYGRLAVAGFRTDGYPQAVRWLWTSGTRCGVIRLGGRRGCRRGRARGSNGSRALQASLARCLRIRSTTRGSVMRATIFHLRSKGTQKRIHLEDLTEQARSGSPPRAAEVDFPLTSLLLHPGRASSGR